MKNLFNIFKKKPKKANQREWYVAEMATECGVRYSSGVRANSEKDAKEIILKNASRGSSILNIKQKSIMED